MVPCSPPFTRMQTDETFDFDFWMDELCFSITNVKLFKI